MERQEITCWLHRLAQNELSNPISQLNEVSGA